MALYGGYKKFSEKIFLNLKFCDILIKNEGDKEDVQ